MSEYCNAKIKHKYLISPTGWGLILSRLAAAHFPVFGYPNLIRFSWSTTREALDKSGACKVKWYEFYCLNHLAAQTRQPSQNMHLWIPPLLFLYSFNIFQSSVYRECDEDDSAAGSMNITDFFAGALLYFNVQQWYRLFLLPTRVACKMTFWLLLNIRLHRDIVQIFKSKLVFFVLFFVFVMDYL